MESQPLCKTTSVSPIVAALEEIQPTTSKRQLPPSKPLRRLPNVNPHRTY